MAGWHVDPPNAFRVADNIHLALVVNVIIPEIGEGRKRILLKSRGAS